MSRTAITQPLTQLYGRKHHHLDDDMPPTRREGRGFVMGSLQAALVPLEAYLYLTEVETHRHTKPCPMPQRIAAQEKRRFTDGHLVALGRLGHLTRDELVAHVRDRLNNWQERAAFIRMVIAVGDDRDQLARLVDVYLRFAEGE